ncbi:Nuclear transition protein 2 [Manis javanica]|nr:Nuclear transition protein 2 [Manis javanica]
MDTETQSLPVTHTQPYSHCRPQSHTCPHCSHSCGRSPAGRCSPPGRQSQGPGPSPPSRRRRHPMQPTAHSCNYPKNMKNLKRKMNKRKGVERSRQVYKTKRRNSGTYKWGRKDHQPPDEGEQLLGLGGREGKPAAASQSTEDPQARVARENNHGSCMIMH